MYVMCSKFRITWIYRLLQVSYGGSPFKARTIADQSKLCVLLEGAVRIWDVITADSSCLFI